MPAEAAAGCNATTTAATPSLMFHLEVDEQHDRRGHNLSPAGKLQAIREGIQSLTDPHTLVESRLMRDVRVLKSAILAEDGEMDPAVLATRLAALGYQVALRTALGGGEGTNCFRNLRNVFLVVYLDPPLPATSSLAACKPGSQRRQQQQLDHGGFLGATPTSQQQACAPEPLIVDCAFPEHFEISQPTPLYATVLRCLPREFVGPASRLKPLVELLAAEMLDAFHAQGLERPPWRQPRSMLSKWLPERSKVRDAQPSSVASSPTAGGEPPACSPTTRDTPIPAAADTRCPPSPAAGEASPTCSSQATNTASKRPCSPQARCTLAFCTMCNSPPKAVASYLRAMAAAAPPELFCKRSPSAEGDTTAAAPAVGGGAHEGQGSGSSSRAHSPKAGQAPLQRRRSLLSSSLAGQEAVAPGTTMRGPDRGYGPHATVRMVRLRGC